MVICTSLGTTIQTKERIRVNASGAIVLIIDSNIGQHFKKILSDYSAPYIVDQEKYLCYNASNLRKAGLID